MRRVLSILLAFGVAGTAIAAAEAPASATSGSVYAVDCSAKQQGAGTISSPWNSLGAVNSHGAFLAGDQILLHRGTVCRGRLHPGGNGVAGSSILLGAYGAGARPLIDGHGTPDRTAAVQLTDQSYWTVQDLHIRNTAGGRSSSVYRAGLLLVNSGSRTLRGLVVRRLTVDSVASNMSQKRASPREWGGIAAVTNGHSAGGFSGLQITGNAVSRVGRTGIVVTNHAYPKGRDVGVRVSGNRVDSSRGDGIVLLGAVNSRIDHNRVSNANDLWPCAECGGISPLTANAAIWTAFSKNVQIDHNEAWKTKLKGGDGEGLDVDSSAVNAVVEYNYSHDNEGGGILLCGSRNASVRFNIFEDNAKAAVSFIGSIPAKDSKIYNNTIYTAAAVKARPVRFFNGAHGSGISFKNNLVYQMNPRMSAYLWPAKRTTAANTLVGYQGAGRPADAKTSYRNPGLKKPGSGKTGFSTLGGYRPSHASTFPRGVAIPKNVTRDFFGKKIDPKRPPRGAAG